MTGAGHDPRRLLVAHPSPDLYGSDLQLVETLRGATAEGWSVVVVLPEHGPLVAQLERAGARVLVRRFPVLRKSLLHPLRLPGLLVAMVVSTVGHALLLRRWRPSAVLVNTLTIPQWLVSSWLAGVPALCHVHEAEDEQPRLVRVLLAAPLLLARRVVANSRAASDALTEVVPRLAARVRVVHNGVAGPPTAPQERPPTTGSARLVLVGRLSPRKGTDVAVAATERLLEEGRDVELVLCGSVFPGYEWFEQELRDRVGSGPAAGRVSFRGYVAPTWPELESADVVLVPSRLEPFGNVAVEAMHACRPVVASAVQGLREVVTDGVTGVLVTPDDPQALADAVRGLLDDPERAARLAAAGHADAAARFSVERYRTRLAAVLDEL